MRDEFPGQAFLTVAQARNLLAYKDHKSWAAFLEANPDFPRMVAVGKTTNGKPRMLYPKSLVYAWIELRISH